MSPDGRPIGILHLSDLHVQPQDQPLELLGPLREDLAKLPETQLAFLVISGDLVDRGNPEAFPVAVEFLRRVQDETQIPWEHVILCPGNHDVQEDQPFAERFAAYIAAYQELTGREPAEDLSHVHTFPAFGLQFVTLNTAHRIDKDHRKDSAVDFTALTRVLKEADEHTSRPFRIAVWHHSVYGDWSMAEPNAALERLASNGFSLLLHGDVHEHRGHIAHQHQERPLHIAGAGTLGAHGA